MLKKRWVASRCIFRETRKRASSFRRLRTAKVCGSRSITVGAAAKAMEYIFNLSSNGRAIRGKAALCFTAKSSSSSVAYAEAVGVGVNRFAIAFLLGMS